MEEINNICSAESGTIAHQPECCGSAAAETKSLTIISALDCVQSMAFRSELNAEFWKSCSAELDYLCRRLDLTAEQAVILSILCELGEAVTWKGLEEFLNLSRLKTMAMTPAMEGLQNKRWIYQCNARERGSTYDGFKLVYGVLGAFRHDRVFEAEKIEDLSLQCFVDRLARYVANEGQDPSIHIRENHRWMLQLVDANLQLPLCRVIKNLEKRASRITLIIAVADFALCAGEDNEGLSLEDLEGWFPEGFDFPGLSHELQSGSNELLRKGMLEYATQDGMADVEKLCLSPRFKEQMLAQFKPRPKRRHRRRSDEADLRKASAIKEKTLFFNSGEHRQLDRLKELLCDDHLAEVQTRLEQNGLRRGITCLFYGAPGTGKTESVLQLARLSGRDIVQVDIAGLRDKFVGESEKHIKQVFRRYRSLCETSPRTPILLFNEADAIINTRLENIQSSVEKMDNAMQNIVLQEMEDLDGILIATTNLTGTLDRAFERRFLFKVEFARPDEHTRSEIWRAMLPDLDETGCRDLAREFNFAGGEIENIARKCRIEHALSGSMPDPDEIRKFCADERLNRDTRLRIGF